MQTTFSWGSFYSWASHRKRCTLLYYTLPRAAQFSTVVAFCARYPLFHGTSSLTSLSSCFCSIRIKFYKAFSWIPSQEEMNRLPFSLCLLLGNCNEHTCFKTGFLSKDKCMHCKQSRGSSAGCRKSRFYRRECSFLFKSLGVIYT